MRRTDIARLWKSWQVAWRQYHSLGRRGERAAESFLRRLGYHIVGRQERGRLGEIDLVAVDGQTVVFVEVKTRASHDAGHPAEAVTADKQARLTRLALVYLRRHDLMTYRARFDVVAITWPRGVRRPTIEHIKSAFQAVGQGQMFC